MYVDRWNQKVKITVSVDRNRNLDQYLKNDYPPILGDLLTRATAPPFVVINFLPDHLFPRDY